MDGTPLAGPADLNKAILSRSGDFAETLIEKLMTFGLGRHVTYRDMPAIRHIARDASRNDEHFSTLILGIATSEPFLMRTRSDDADPGAPSERFPQKTADLQQPGNGAS
jgi:hypothetical protein